MTALSIFTSRGRIHVIFYQDILGNPSTILSADFSCTEKDAAWKFVEDHRHLLDAEHQWPIEQPVYFLGNGSEAVH